jgi:hypothetical protein
MGILLAPAKPAWNACPLGQTGTFMYALDIVARPFLPRFPLFEDDSMVYGTKSLAG